MTVARDRLDELLGQFSDDVAFYTFLRMEREAREMGASASSPDVDERPMPEDRR